MNMKFSCIFIALLFCATLHAQSYRHDYGTAEAYLDSLSNQIGQSRYKEVLADCSAFIQYSAQKKGKTAQMMLAQAWSVKGDAYLKSRTGDGFWAALECQEKARDIRLATLGPRALEVAFSYHNIGNCYLQASGFEVEAEVWLKKSQRIKQNYPNLNDGSTLESLGHVFIDTRRLSTARQYFNSALKNYGVGNPKSVNTLLALGGLLLEENQSDSALLVFSTAQDLLLGQPNFSKETEAVIKGQKAISLQNLGRYQDALQYYIESIGIFDLLTQVKPSKLGNTLKNAGDCYLDMGDTETAWACYQRALILFKPRSAEYVNVLTSIGLTYYMREDMQPAIDTFCSVIKICSDTSGRKFTEVAAATYFHLGKCFIDRQSWTGARFYFQKSADNFHELGKSKYQITALCKMGFVLIEQGHLMEAERLLQNILQQHQASSSGTVLFPIWLQLGRLYEKKGAITKATQSFEHALASIGATSIIASVPFPNQAAIVWAALARLDLQQQPNIPSLSLKNALYNAENAIYLIETYKEQVNDNLSTIDIQHGLSEPYNLAIQACLSLVKYDTAYTERAFRLSEQSKSHFLRQMTYRALMQSAPALAHELEHLQQKVSDLQKKRFEQTSPDTALDREIQEATIYQYKIRLQLEVENSDFFRQMHQFTPLSLDSIRHQLSMEQIVLNYHWLDDQIVLFIVRKNKTEVHHIPLSDSIGNDIIRLSTLLEQPPFLVASEIAEQQNEQLTVIASRLYKALLSPVAKDSGSTLLVVPDNLLYYLPFDALIARCYSDPNKFWMHQYAVDLFNVQYASSATAFWQENKKVSSASGALTVAPRFFRNSPLDSLENNTKEANLIHAITGGVLLVGDNASKTQVLQQMNGKRFVNLATHGMLNYRQPAYAYLAFNRVSDSSNYERLYLSEIYDLNLSAQLVLVSACHSGGGRLYRGEGLISLAHAFRYAGARDVVASLWAVDDGISPELMRLFYAKYIKGGHLAVALSSAKRTFIRDKRIKSHPFYWAGFVCWGNSPAESKDINIPWWIWVFMGGGIIWYIVKLNWFKYKPRSKKLETST
jgi:CHAT domain-containing protein/Tfp pilus assembly protein PilF